MIIVIDAYNVLKQQVDNLQVSDAQRERFIKLCGKYGKAKGHKMVVVFDAGPYDMTTQMRQHDAYVVYSGYKETADTYIKHYLRQHKEYDVLLVSSDSDIARTASHLGIPSIDSDYFYEIMQQDMRNSLDATAAKNTQPIKLTKRKNEELDALMHEASEVVPTKSADVLNDLQPDTKKMSKQDRQMLKKIKKL